MRLLKWCFFNWLFCIVAVSLALTIGRLRPLPEKIAILHLDQCEFPCWSGIILGKTSWGEAIRYIKDEYVSDRYSVQFIDDSHIKITVNGTFDVLEIVIKPMSYSSEESMVYGIVLIPTANSDSNILKMGDMMASIGPPDNIILSSSINNFAAVLRFKGNRVHIRIDPPSCNRVLTEQNVVSISFYA